MGTNRKIKSDGNIEIESGTTAISSNATIGGTLVVTGQSTLSGIAYPTADGNTNQVLKTNGSGTLSFADQAGADIDTIASASDATSYTGTAKFIHVTSSADVTFSTNLSNRIIQIDNCSVTFEDMDMKNCIVQNVEATKNITIKNTTSSSKDVKSTQFILSGDFFLTLTSTGDFDFYSSKVTTLGDITCALNSNNQNLTGSEIQCSHFSNTDTSTNYIQLISGATVKARLASGYIKVNGGFLFLSQGPSASTTLKLENDDGVLHNSTNASDACMMVGEDGIQATIAARATLSGNQSITTASPAKIEFDTETFDTFDCYDSSTNYRFTAKVKGLYRVTAHCVAYNLIDQQLKLHIYKNGASYNKNSLFQPGEMTGRQHGSISDIVELSVDDYVEIYADTQTDTTYNVSLAESNICVDKIN